MQEKHREFLCFLGQEHHSIKLTQKANFYSITSEAWAPAQLTLLIILAQLGKLRKKSAESDLVYLTGGVPSVLVERLIKSGIRSLLEGFGGVIVGRSAGALALCRKCVITYRSNAAVKVIDGLGLVDITLKAHYKLGRDKELKELSKKEDIFAVPKGSALVCDNKKLSAINNVYLFCSGERQIFS